MSDQEPELFRARLRAMAAYSDAWQLNPTDRAAIKWVLGEEATNQRLRQENTALRRENEQTDFAELRAAHVQDAATITTLRSQVTRLEGDASKWRTRAEYLEPDNDALRAEVDTLRTELEHARQDVNDARHQLEGQAEDNLELRTEMERVRGALAETPENLRALALACRHAADGHDIAVVRSVLVAVNACIPSSRLASTPTPATRGQGERGEEPGTVLAEARALVDEQAEDPGLWCPAETAPEAYLQAELRRLHQAVEAATQQAPAAPVGTGDRSIAHTREVYDLLRSYGYHEGSYGELRRPGTTLTAVSANKRRENDILAVVQHLLDELNAEVSCTRWCGWKGPKRRLQSGRCPLCCHSIPPPTPGSPGEGEPRGK